MSTRRLLAGVLVWLATCVPQAGAREPRAPFTVLTLNLWHDQHDWPARLARIVREVRTLAPDVICLQEVLQHPGLPNQAVTLAESLGCEAYFVSVDGEERPKRYGNAILTRLPIVSRDGEFLRPLDDYRVAAHVRVTWQGEPVDVYDTHLHHTEAGGAIRAEQVRHLLEFVARTRGAGRAVVAGDFNCEPGSPELAPLEAAWADAHRAVFPHASAAEAATFNARFGAEARAIDHVFTPRTDAARWRVREARILFRDTGPDSVWASDHYGVLARLEPAGKGAR